MSNVIRKKPKNPVTQLFEKFPEQITFEKPVVTKSKTVSMVVLVGQNKDKFRGIGPNKKTAKLAAARCALREHKKRNKIWNFLLLKLIAIFHNDESFPND